MRPETEAGGVGKACSHTRLTHGLGRLEGWGADGVPTSNASTSVVDSGLSAFSRGGARL